VLDDGIHEQIEVGAAAAVIRDSDANREFPVEPRLFVTGRNRQSALLDAQQNLLVDVVEPLVRTPGDSVAARDVERASASGSDARCVVTRPARWCACRTF
jgi:hypothetical protein